MNKWFVLTNSQPKIHEIFDAVFKMMVNTNMKSFVSCVLLRNKGRWDKDQEMEEILQSFEKYVIADDSYVSVLEVVFSELQLG